MAQRFGGKFSPGQQQDDPQPADWQGEAPARAGGRVNFLFVAPLPLAVRAFFLPPTAMAATLGALAVLLLGAWLTRDGVRAHQAFDARRVARRPAIPRKIFGAVLTGAGLFLAAWAGSGIVVNAAAIATTATVLHLVAFGPDPLRDKGMEGVDSFQHDRVARAVSEAEKHLRAMSDAILRAGDRKLERRVEAFQATVREMFRTVEEDPRDLTAARRYLSVYLLGARDATVKFADIYARSRDADARAKYERLLDDLERDFASRTKDLLTDDRLDLDIEIEVLRERLEREGVRTRTETKGD